MPRDIVKQHKITFATSPPMGTRGTFTHDGELWIAYPASKNQRIITLIDRLLGIHNRVRGEMIRWINARPGDAELVARVLEMTSRAQQLYDEINLEKAEAVTM